MASVQLVLRNLTDLTKSESMQHMLMEKSQRVWRRAYSTAPVVTGAYRASLHTDLVWTDRLVARIYADAPYAATVEYGDSAHTKRRVLTSALEAAR